MQNLRRRKFPIAFTVTVLLASSIAGSVAAVADDLDDQMAAAQIQAAKIKDSKAQLEKDLEGTTNKLKIAVLALNEIEARLPLAKAELLQAEASVATAKRESIAIATRLNDAQAESKAVTEFLADNEIKQVQAHKEIAARARKAAKGDTLSTLGLVTGAQTPTDFTTSLAASAALNRVQARQVASHQDAAASGKTAQARLAAVTEQILSLKTKADNALVAANKAEAEAKARKSEIDTLHAKQLSVNADIEAQRDEELQEIEDSKADQEAIQKEIKKLAADQAERDRIIEEMRRKEEEERIAREKAEKEERERLEKERKEQERLAKEQAERDRIAKEKADKERLEREQAEAKRLAEEQAERDRLAREQAERDYLACEQRRAAQLANPQPAPAEPQTTVDEDGNEITFVPAPIAEAPIICVAPPTYTAPPQIPVAPSIPGPEPVTPTPTFVDPTPTFTTSSKKSFLDWPTNPVFITSSYGTRMHPTLKIMRTHAGIDLRAYCGTPVYAAQSGIVVKREWFGTGGNMVMIDHGKDGSDRIMTRYLHLSKYNVQLNDWVKKGQIVGYSGMTGGVSTGCHLHFEVYVNGSHVNPVTRLP